MNEHPEDNLIAEEFDLTQVRPGSFGSLFTELDDIEFELEDDDERPAPAFGSLADDEERPLLGEPPSVFDPLTREERDSVELPPVPQRRRRPVTEPSAPVVHVPEGFDDGPAAEPEAEDFSKLSWREKLAAARAGAAETADEPKPSKPKMTLRERVAAARGETFTAPDDEPALMDRLAAFDDDVQDTSLVDIDAPPPKMSVRERVAAARQAAKEEAGEKRGLRIGRAAKEDATVALAGLDVSAPSSLDTLRDRFRSKPATAPDQPQAAESRFGELLTPLSGAELQMLQFDLQQDEAMFVRLGRARRLGAIRQRVGFVVGLLCLAMFGASVGGDYLTSVLPDAPLPEWAANVDAQYKDIVGGVLFGFGLLLPLAAVFVLADGVKYLWRGLDDRRIDDMVLGCFAIIATGGMYVPLQTGQVAVSGGFLVAWLAARGFVRIFTRLVNRRAV